MSKPKFRLVKSEHLDAAMNMALEEVILNKVSENKCLPTIRFFSWKPSAVTIGYFQGIKNEVDITLAKEKGIDITRRITGGGAVFHDSLGEITYSIIGPLDLFPEDVLASYHEICSYLIAALEYLGIHAEYKKINDVMVDGKKISGSAQTRKKGVLVQHGTLIYSADPLLMFSLLKGRVEKNKLTKSNKQSVTWILEHKDISIEKVLDALISAFSEGKEIVHETLTKEELAEAKALAKDKYTSEEWLNLR